MTSPFAAKLVGTGSGFPAKRLSNDELAKSVETTDEWIRERTGIRERRISTPGLESETNSSLALAAATRALEMAGKRAEDIDQILFATCTPDTVIPSASCWLQKKLGATKAFAVDLNAACSGFVYALSVADQFMRSGNSKLSLVVGGDVLSSITDWKDRTSCILFGDGAGAVILERTALTTLIAFSLLTFKVTERSGIFFICPRVDPRWRSYSGSRKPGQ